MKNRFLVIFIMFLGLAVSCSKDSDEDGTNPVKIDKTANLKATGGFCQ